MINHDPYHCKISADQHSSDEWKVSELLPDFMLEDAWRFPVTLEPHHTLPEFKVQMTEAMTGIQEKGISGILFRIRLFVGDIFGWDPERKDPEEHPGSLRSRYANSEGIPIDTLTPLEGKDFETVYNLENESLAEIENATVHAALHFGRIKNAEGKFSVQMGVYVKPKGTFGKIYMQLIKLPRHWIVYPTLMKIVKKRWLGYVNPA